MFQKNQHLKGLFEILETGLNTVEVEEQRKRFGFNEVIVKKVNFWLQFVKKFWGLTAWLLEIISSVLIEIC